MSFTDLPAPPPEALAATAALRERIRAEIAAAGGRLSFARFMELALYAPGQGYYAAGLRRFGPGGDFVTAPEISPLFGRCVARQVQEVLSRSGGEVLEAGAGSGALAAQVLLELERMDALPQRYSILELSGPLREIQAQTLHRQAPHLAPRVRWLERLPEPGLRGVVLANEVLDAMPVHRIGLTDAGVVEHCVGVQGEGFAWRPAAPVTEALGGALEALLGELDAPLAAGYVTEVGLAAAAWTASLAGVLEAGAILLLDYGFPRRELYHPQRSQGTLMCHYRHRAHGDPLILVGLQDITAHVDFSALAEAGAGAGLHVAGYTSQADFLLGTGLLQVLEQAQAQADEAGRYALAGQVKRLTLPSEMGELFKAMLLTRAIEGPFSGFAGRDRRGAL